MKTKTDPLFLSTGVLWGEGQTPYNRNYRHNVRQDELNHFEWIYNDGKQFGIEMLVDQKADAVVNASFIVNDNIKDGRGWTQQFDIRKEKVSVALPFIFYMGAECDKDDSSVCFSSSDVHSVEVISYDVHSLRAVGYTSLSGWFSLDVVVDQDKEQQVNEEDDRSGTYPSFISPSLSYLCPARPGIHSIAEEIEKSSETNRHRMLAASRGKSGRKRKKNELIGAVFDLDSQELPNKVENSATGVTVQVMSKVSFRMTVTFTALPGWTSIKDVYDWSRPADGVTHDQRLSGHITAFNKKFETIYGLEEKGFDEDDMDIARKALSNTLGGLGYFHGTPVIGDATEYTDKKKQQKGAALAEGAVNTPEVSLSLFSATPSRSSFPRGFLWDEGFHQMLISQWDPSITMEVVSHWMGCMLHSTSSECDGGWIPRELILGYAATRVVPSEFVTQRVDVANPPTLLLVIEGMVDSLERIDPRTCLANEMGSSCGVDEDRESLFQFLGESYGRLHDWVQWLLHSQRGMIPGSFRWRGRKLDNSRLITNTLSSGLDDYPRSAFPSEDEYHVDILCWVIASVRAMGKLNAALTAHGVNDHLLTSTRDMYSDDALAFYSQRLVDLHWSDKHGMFLDVGLVGEQEKLSMTASIRCGAGDRRRGYVEVAVEEDHFMHAMQTKDFNSLCPRQFPMFISPAYEDSGALKSRRVYETSEPRGLRHIPRIGYVNLFPLLLCVLAPDSQQLSMVLDILESRDHLWSDHGLRSMSTKDLFYKVENAPGDAPYWRGPIWIPVNYLAIKALKYYSSIDTCIEKERSLRLYTELRSNVIRTILTSYKETGYFWEQYDDISGSGMRGHPFSGWTALLLNIMAEAY